MIYKEMQAQDFWTWLNQDKDSSYYQYFSYEAAIALFEWLDEITGDNDEYLAFDPIAWCVEYTEWDSLKEFNKEMGTEFTSWDQVVDNTTVLQLEDGKGVVQDY